MACFIPFNNKNLDISFFAFRPTVVLVGDLIDALKQFSVFTESLGCVQSSLIQSIHGSMIIWYGGWLKKSCENKEALVATLISMLSNISSMAILIEHSFFDSYAGDSRHGGTVAKFSAGDTLSMSVASLTPSTDASDLSYACLALFKSKFISLESVTSGVCLRSQTQATVACVFVWKSLQSCYAWILSTDQRSSVQPYLERFDIDLKYDIFRVVYISSDSVLSLGFLPSHHLLAGQGGESPGQGQIMQKL